MRSYELTKDAERDLREVARYTLNKWGSEMLQQYRDGLKETFQRIGKDEVSKRQFLNKYPELYLTKYKYHFIFFLTEELEIPVIIGMIHERRDIVNRLPERLQNPSD